MTGVWKTKQVEEAREKVLTMVFELLDKRMATSFEMLRENTQVSGDRGTQAKMLEVFVADGVNGFKATFRECMVAYLAPVEEAVEAVVRAEAVIPEEAMAQIHRSLDAINQRTERMEQQLCPVGGSE